MVPLRRLLFSLSNLRDPQRPGGPAFWADGMRCGMRRRRRMSGKIALASLRRAQRLQAPRAACRRRRVPPRPPRSARDQNPFGQSGIGRSRTDKNTLPPSMSAHSHRDYCRASRHSHAQQAERLSAGRYNLFDTYLKGNNNLCSPARACHEASSATGPPGAERRPTVRFDDHARSVGTATSRMRNCTRSRPCQRSIEIEPAT